MLTLSVGTLSTIVNHDGPTSLPRHSSACPFEPVVIWGRIRGRGARRPVRAGLRTTRLALSCGPGEDAQRAGGLVILTAAITVFTKPAVDIGCGDPHPRVRVA